MSNKAKNRNFWTPRKNQGRGRGNVWVLWSSGAYNRTSGIHLMGDSCTVWLSKVPVKINELENVAIANALQLEAARRRSVPLRFNFVVRAKFEVAQPIRRRLRAFLLLIRYIML